MGWIAGVSTTLQPVPPQVASALCRSLHLKGGKRFDATRDLSNTIKGSYGVKSCTPGWGQACSFLCCTLHRCQQPGDFLTSLPGFSVIGELKYNCESQSPWWGGWVEGPAETEVVSFDCLGSHLMHTNHNKAICGSPCFLIQSPNTEDINSQS